MNHTIKFKPSHKIANSESNDLPTYLKSTQYPSYHICTQISKPPQKKYCPEQSYGVSYESPTYFRAKHTLVNQNSYKNPYLTNPEDYDFSSFTKMNDHIPKTTNSKLSHTQTFKIGESYKEIENNVFKKTRLPALTTYNCILDKKNQLKERDMIIQENSSFVQDFNKFSEIPNSFHRDKGLFGDFVERNNIMNVFGHLLKRERNQTFVDRSKEFSSTGDSLERSKQTNKNNNYSKTDILNNLNNKDNSIESLSSLLNKQPNNSQITSKGAILVQNGSSVEFANIKYPHIKKFKLDELKPITFSLSKQIKKLRENAMKYPSDIEKFCKNDQKYMNSMNNSILKTKIFETIQQNNQEKKLSHSYSTKKIHLIYREKTLDLDKFEAVSKFYKFLQPLSKTELQKRYKVKAKELKNICNENNDESGTQQLN